jgi:undecaprenyl-diphosphatase
LEIYQAVILGLVQGFTEFLPVSSSGHLVLGKALFGIQEQGIAFEVFVHFGTLLAVVTVFFHELWNIILSPFTSPGMFSGLAKKYHSDSNFQMLIYLLIGTIPAGLIGVLYKSKIEQAFSNPKLTCIMLFCTGLVLLSTIKSWKGYKEVSLWKALVIGLAQAVAILPGISRSGSTISTGLHLKLNGEKAATFSFLLSVPAILGATILKFKDIIETGITSDLFILLAAGTIASYFSGYVAIESLLKIVRQGKLYWFAPYCLIIGLAGFILL